MKTKNLLMCVILIAAIFLGISKCSIGEFPEMLIENENGKTFPASDLKDRPEKVILYYWGKNDTSPKKELIKLNTFHKKKIRPKMATIFVGSGEEIKYVQENIIHVSTFSFNTFYATAKIKTPLLVITEAGSLKRTIENPNLEKILEDI